tara:strand:- start:346 stop:2808 length:2463 start_codon:yes stop_codon:yes gene_type:complete
MSQEKILIKFTARGDKRLVRSMHALADAQARLEKRTRETGKQLDVFGTRNKRLAQTNSVLSNSFATLRSKMLLFSFAVSMGGRQLVQFAKDAAKLEGMKTAFDTLSGGAGNAQISLEKLTAATDGTMSNMDLLQQANNAMVLGVSKNSDEMSELFDMAQRLGKALGQDTVTSVQSLITGMGRQSKLMLDNIGIVIKTEKAYMDYARELRKNVADLTDAERKQAFMNAVLESAREKVGELGDEQRTASESLQALSASFQNFQSNVGDAVLMALVPFAEALTAIMDLFTTERIFSYIGAITALAAGFLVAKKGAIAAMLGVKALKVALVTSGIGIAVVAIGELIHALGTMGKDSSKDMDDFGDSTAKAVNHLGLMRDIVMALKADKLAGVNREIETLEQLMSQEVFQDRTGAFDWDQLLPLADSPVSLGLMGTQVREYINTVQKEMDNAFRGLGPEAEGYAEEFQNALFNILDEYEQLPPGHFANFLEDTLTLPSGLLTELGLAHQIVSFNVSDHSKSLAVLLDTEENREKLRQLSEKGQEYYNKLLEKQEEITMRQQLALASILPNLQKENAILDAKTTLQGDALALRLLEIEHADQWKNLSTDQIAGLEAEIKKRRELKETLDDQAESERKLEQSIKAQKKEREAQISSLVQATTQFALYSQEVAKNMKELTEVILGELQKILTQFISNQILYSIFGIGDAPTLFGKTFQELLQGITGGASGSSVVQGANDLAVGVAHSGGMITSYHQGGNVPIIAQEGEFVMRRSAVESIGVENLNRMNRTGSAGVNVTFSGNVLSKSFIEREAIPMIKKAIRRGKTLG